MWPRKQSNLCWLLLVCILWVNLNPAGATKTNLVGPLASGGSFSQYISINPYVYSFLNKATRIFFRICFCQDFPNQIRKGQGERGQINIVFFFFFFFFLAILRRSPGVKYGKLSFFFLFFAAKPAAKLLLQEMHKILWRKQFFPFFSLSLSLSPFLHISEAAGVNTCCPGRHLFLLTRHFVNKILFD